MKSYIVCFDIGGTSLKCAVCDTAGTMYHKEQIEMKETLDELCQSMKDYKEMMQQTYPIEGVAISSCGAVDCDTGIIHGCSAVPYIHGPDWFALMRDYLHLPCSIENDANCAALSQLYFGKATHVNDMCFMVIGTGVGGAIVKNRKIHHGKHLYGGEFGMMLARNSQGKLVNISLVASTSSMVRNISERQPGTWDGKRVFEEAERGNQDCLSIIQQFYDEVAFCVFNIQHTIDPELILFGGAISARFDFCDRVMEAYKRLVADVDIVTLTPTLMCCSYLQDANLLGALAHYLQQPDKQHA